MTRATGATDHPRLMVKLLVYGYCQGVRASRKIAERLDEDVAFRALAAGNRPDFRTISDFRKIHLGTLEGLFEQVLRLALDGTKMKAGGGFEQAYNAQAAVEPECQLIVGQTLTNEANDKRQLQPLTKRNGEPVAGPRGRPPAGLGLVERMRRKPGG